MRLCLLSLLLIPLIIQAAPHKRYYHPHRKPPKITTQVQAVDKLHWKPIVASGVAGGTIIAAYKISDGIQEGTKTVAKEHPDKFNSWLSALAIPLRFACGILLLVLIIWALPKLIPLLQKTTLKKG